MSYLFELVLEAGKISVKTNMYILRNHLFCNVEHNIIIIFIKHNENRYIFHMGRKLLIFYKIICKCIELCIFNSLLEHIRYLFIKNYNNIFWSICYNL